MSDEPGKDPSGYPLTHSYEDQLRSIGEGRLFSLAHCAAEEIKRLKTRAEKAEAELAKREKALIGAEGILSAQGDGFIKNLIANVDKYGATLAAHCPTLPSTEELQELAEWLKLRAKS